MSTTPPGWYLSPNEPGTNRYWDGNAWTEHTSLVVQKKQRSAWKVLGIIVGVLFLLAALSIGGLYGTIKYIGWYGNQNPISNAQYSSIEVGMKEEDLLATLGEPKVKEDRGIDVDKSADYCHVYNKKEGFLNDIRSMSFCFKDGVLVYKTYS